MNRLTENLLLFMVGLAIAVITFTGNYTRYVKPSLLPWLIAAAVLITVLALTAIGRDARRWCRRTVEEDHDGGHAHDGHSHSPSIVWLLALPAAVLVFVPAPALGATAAAPRVDEVSGWHRHAFAPIPEGGAPELPLNDVLMRLANDTAGTLDGRLITVVGFTVTQGAQTYLGRYYIICCAADARLHRLELGGAGAEAVVGYPDGTWVSVTGRVVQGATPSRVPNLIVSDAQTVPEPADPYDYPS